ncbi:MAG: hypothetical protein PHI12_10895 [Dehalococcoidales bacterium]|nr:hypothetical protein [Dehalococcoidales bacterium]
MEKYVDIIERWVREQGTVSLGSIARYIEGELHGNDGAYNAMSKLISTGRIVDSLDGKWSVRDSDVPR